MMTSGILRGALAFLMIAGSRAEVVSLAIDPGRINQVEIRKVGNGEVEVTTRGEDSFVYLKDLPPVGVASECTVLAFEYFCPEGVRDLRAYYGPPVTGDRTFLVGSLARAESWMPFSADLVEESGGAWSRVHRELRLDFGQRAGTVLRVRNLVLRAPTAEELRTKVDAENARREKLVREEVINAYYAAEFPSHIEAVGVDRESVTIQASRGSVAGELHLLELRPEISLATDVTHDSSGFTIQPRSGVVQAASLTQDAKISRQVPRRAEGRDRVTSRWALAEPCDGGGWILRSHCVYATDLSGAAEHTAPPAKVSGIKGMGGVSPAFPLEELIELGVRHITINLDILSVIDTQSHPGWEEHEFGGRRWFVNVGHLSYFDKMASFAERNGMVASGILLLNFRDTEFAKQVIHPEADRAGHYAMPNLTSAEGTLAYEAGLELLAARYSQPGFPHGRIANWIVHNEVGYGWEWTNMGRQPPMVYMDAYLRSMRLVHSVVRRHDPHARVFISLTHHWNTPGDGEWRSYCNRDLMNRLVASSHLEGDFAWGLAYHPYPENLRDPRAWDDTRVSDCFDTPLITPKNIAVLDRLMHQPAWRDSSGRVRGLLLSEQGFNSPDYSEESQRLQAAGFAYMWRQLDGLESVEAFHNHRWVDQPNEGGLLLGLRKLPEEGRPYGDKKLAWDVYKALDTVAEESATRFADEVIGE